MTDFACSAKDLDPCYAAFREQFPEYDQQSAAYTFWREGWAAANCFVSKMEPEPIPFFGWFR